MDDPAAGLVSSLGVLLAAGASRRMKRPKLTLRLGARTLLERSLAPLLEAGLDEVRVVTSPSRDDLDAWSPPGTVVLVNASADEGIASSIRTGLVDVADDVTTVVIALADMPFVRPETIRELVAARERSGAAAAHPVFAGRRGNPVAWDRALVDELRRLTGDRGASALFEALGDRVLAVPVDDPGVLEDVDTPEDLERARSR